MQTNTQTNTTSRLPYGTGARLLRELSKPDGSFNAKKALTRLRNRGVSPAYASTLIWASSDPDPSGKPGIRKLKASALVPPPREAKPKTKTKLSAPPRKRLSRAVIDKALWAGVKAMPPGAIKTADLKAVVGQHAWAVPGFLNEHGVKLSRGTWLVGNKDSAHDYTIPAVEGLPGGVTKASIDESASIDNKWASIDKWWEANLINEDGHGATSPVAPALGTEKDPICFDQTIRIVSPATSTIYWLTALNAGITTIGFVVAGKLLGM